MVRRLCAGALTFLALSGYEVSGQSAMRKGEVTVIFKKEVSDGEALWVLRSYRVPFDIVERRISRLQIASRDLPLLNRVEQNLIDASTRGVLGRCVIGRSSLPSSDPESVSLLLYGEVCHSEKLQQDVERLVPKGITLKWVVEPPYALISVLPGTEDAWIRLFSEEPAIQGTAVEEWPNSASVEASGTVRSGEVVSIPKNTVSVKNLRRPYEVDVAAKTLPPEVSVTQVLRALYRGMNPRVSVIKSERDVDDEYFEIAVDGLKGSVTNPPYWEKLRFSIPILLSRDHVLKIRCVLDGQFAPGVGNVMPPATAFQDLEPQYTGQLQDMVNRFVLALRTGITKGLPHD